MKGLVVHGLFALGGLVAAYEVWTDGEHKEIKEGQVTILECGKNDLQSVTVENKSKRVVLEVKRGSGDAYPWLTSTSLMTPSNGQPAPEPARFVGNEQALDYLKGFSPFYALRSLGKLGKDSLKQVELDKPETQFSISCGGKSRHFVVGGSTYGSGDRYVVEKKSDGPVYLIPSAVVRDLEGAEFRFMQRKLTAFTRDAIEEVRVEAEGKTKTLLQRNRRDAKQAEWVDAAQPDRRNELYGNWIGKIDQLQAQSYLSPGKEPGSEIANAVSGGVPVVTLTFKADGEPQFKLELVKVEVSSAQPADANNPVQEFEFYARTPRTRSWVKVLKSVAKQIETDVVTVLSGEQAGDKPGAPPAKTQKPAAPVQGGLPAGHPAVH